MEPETIFSSAFSPNPGRALDVLAFVLTPARAFAPTGDDEEQAAVEALLDSAKAEAVRRWSDLRDLDRRN